MLGFTKTIKSIDGKNIEIKRNEITPDGFIIKKKGMGLKKNILFNGDLLINIKVDVLSLTKKQIEQLSSVL